MGSLHPMQRITLYRGFPYSGKHVWSPFVTKLEARLRFAGVSYVTAGGNPRASPKGKIPYVEYAVGGDDAEPTVMSDSTLIIGRMVELGVLPDLNGAIGSLERSHDLGLRAMLEDRVYFLTGWEKWVENYYIQRDHVLQSIPWPARVLVGLIVHRKNVAMLQGQGAGRFSPEEMEAFREEVWASLADQLAASKARLAGRGGGDEGVFWALGGEAPTEADATVFGFVVSALVCTSNPKTQKIVKGHPILLEYARRIQEKYFPDYENFGN